MRTTSNTIEFIITVENNNLFIISKIFRYNLDIFVFIAEKAEIQKSFTTKISQTMKTLK